MPVLIVPVASTNVLDTGASITFMLIGAIFASFLVPMLISLLLFSTRESRRRSLFYLNASALLFGIVQGVMLTALYARTLLRPHSDFSGLSLAVNIIFLFSPLLVESILLLRLAAVFPSREHGRRVLFAVLAFPVVIRIARLVNMCIAIAALSSAAAKLQSNTKQWWALLPYVRVEWFLALVDITYVSVVFLYRLRTHAPSTSTKQSSAMAARVRRLFLIAVGNFLLPGLLNFVQLILVFVLPDHRDPPATQTRLFFVCAFIMVVFNYVCIVGVVFATIWSTGTSAASGWSTGPQASASYATARRSAASARPVSDRPSSMDTLIAPLIAPGGSPLPTQLSHSDEAKSFASQDKD